MFNSNYRSTRNTTNNNNAKCLESVSCWVSQTSSEGSSGTVPPYLTLSGGT